MKYVKLFDIFITEKFSVREFLRNLFKVPKSDKKATADVQDEKMVVLYHLILVL